jgi:hypothetical protein
MFIHARSEANGIRKFQAKNFRGQFRRTEKALNRIESEPTAARAGQRADGFVVRDFGILPEEEGPDELFMQPAHF